MGLSIHALGFRLSSRDDNRLIYTGDRYELIVSIDFARFDTP